LKLVLSPRARVELGDWIRANPKIAAKAVDVMEEALRSPFSGTGKPEPLKHGMAGSWSRRITDEHRLVYRISGKAPDQILEIISCRFHYGDR
jgi:toxin YoeB